LAGSRIARVSAGDRDDVVSMFDCSLAERRVAFSSALRNLRKYGTFPSASMLRLLLCDRIGNSLPAVSLVQVEYAILDLFTLTEILKVASFLHQQPHKDAFTYQSTLDTSLTDGSSSLMLCVPFIQFNFSLPRTSINSLFLITSSDE